MNILLISQCNKQALPETRRILDQFAERKGDRTWQTPITQEGLNTLQMLLKKTARRNTAVACHWIRGVNNSELLWIIGNRRRFNDVGTVPTNTTKRNILRSEDENRWDSCHSFSLLAALAGLFHDWGKANTLFQQKLKGQRPLAEPYRHEWVSLCLFRAFVAGKSDKEWLTQLLNVDAELEHNLLENLSFSETLSPFKGLTGSIAQSVAWLIVSHHRLPTYLPRENNPQIDKADHWLTEKLNPEWNATNHHNPAVTASEKKDNFQFPAGTPLRSQTWCRMAQQFAKRALNHPKLASYAVLTEVFPTHMARLCLMLADHIYSSGLETERWQDKSYQAYANTDRVTKKLKQQLDEHNIGVAQLAYRLGLHLPQFRQTLPAITRHKKFKQRSTIKKYRWQDQAYELTAAIKETTQQCGFFGINMASTGCGKTLANAKIMYALSDNQMGCRFSIAIGLRTLTLQTGDALRDRLSLKDDDLAILIGSQAVKQLHQYNQSDELIPKEENDDPLNSGSESESIFAEHHYVSYQGSVDDGPIGKWLARAPSIHKLVSAPITVSTIDYLISATEGTRGGQQIAPMLRLLNADLVLDEPDDFALEDLPALCRLVNWAGLLGSRILISSATLPPSFIKALFDAYYYGRQQYNRSHHIKETDICCAWFDEFESSTHQLNSNNLKPMHHQFIAKRAQILNKKSLPLRCGELAKFDDVKLNKQQAIQLMAQIIHPLIQQLHERHHVTSEQHKQVSVGLVRMANIEPLVAVANTLFTLEPMADTRIHYCVYHSRHPLAVRAFIEHQLDSVLMRDPQNPDGILSVPSIKDKLQHYPETKHIFVVIATPVAEVGRDHDYDWAIVEPSSMRSIIQLAGRVQRHRQIAPNTPNIVLLNKNIKGLMKENVVFCKPGFEQTGLFSLSSHDLSAILAPEYYSIITAEPRFIEPLINKPLNFISLEHAALIDKLFLNKQTQAQYWWKQDYLHLFGQLQKITLFRASKPQQAYFVGFDDDENINFDVFYKKENQWKNKSDLFTPYKNVIFSERNQSWFNMSYQDIYQSIADNLNVDINDIGRTFGEINLDNHPNTTPKFIYHPLLGIIFGSYLI
nr:type I-F CRISPR-associated helicase Cas3f [uncultured Moellerella sp.]